MKLLRKRDIPEERYANAFLGYGPEDSHFVIELTYSKGTDYYLVQFCQPILLSETANYVLPTSPKLLNIAKFPQNTLLF